MTQQAEPKKAVSDILGGSGSAAKFRDHLGEVCTIESVRSVSTKNGPSSQLVTTEHGPIWAPSIVETQVRELDASGFLPMALRFESVGIADGKSYFTLVDPDEQSSADTATPPPPTDADAPPATDDTW